MDKETYREVLTRASSFLEEQGKEGYSIQFLLLERKKWSKLDWLLHMNEPITAEDAEQVKQDLQALVEDVPAQYLLGEAEFYGERFKVTSATLIPRPETEELVELCLKETSEDQQSVVDIGTGTGAIAISVKKARPAWRVSAIDLSETALLVAEENAERLQTPIDFFLGDTLVPVEGQRFDLILSNPPYIADSEWALMDPSVRKYEPKTALFAENDGLAIYQKIAEQAPRLLNPKGKIFLEIGFRQGKAVQAIFQQAFPEKQVEIRKDLFGNERIIYVHD